MTLAILRQPAAANSRQWVRPLTWMGWLALAVGLLRQNVAHAEETIRFNRDVRPILSNNCFYCHGPDPKHREADLRLDLREGATADLGGYAAIVPGDPKASQLLARVTSQDEDEAMPPPHSKKGRLTTEQVAVLRKWIEQGAKYEGHWAFQPIAAPVPPEVSDPAWRGHPIDRFILQRLAQEGIKPSPPADRATLIRRVSLDLTGLLPTPEETEAFVRDADPAAYEKLVDRLLASPHYGERWGRHWLDQARYADSNGYTVDSDRAMWPYRDWVIDALNRDMPFNQFTIEQLAGDLLPNPTKSQLVATAFHRNTLINEEGGTDKEQFRHEAVVDRVNTTGAVWLGLTIGCAQCHTHKFDPIPHREYYELFAFFNQGTDVNNKGATVRVAEGEMFRQPADAPTPPGPDPVELARRRAAWEKKELARLSRSAAPSVVWSPAKYVEYDTKTGAGFQRLDDNSLLSDGRGSDNDTYRIVVQSPQRKVAAVRLRGLTHESLPKNGPGLASNGNFVITAVTLEVDGEPLPIATAFADHEQPGYPARGAIDNNPKTGWAINVARGSTARMNADHEAVFVLEKPVELAGRSLEVKLFHDLNENYLIGRFAIDVAEVAPAPPVTVADQALLAALRTASNKRNAAQAKLIETAFEPAEGGTAASQAKKVAAADVMVMKDLPKPRPTHIALRGDFLTPDRKTGPLQPGGLAAVGPPLPTKEGRTRLDLAGWLVDPQNPLTARVTVNRIWMHYFGRGLVETEEDFGTQGSPPTHPELLDWLAGELIRRGWSLKAMHRLIVTSNTYRQSSRFRPELMEKDPRNLLLARQERVRIEAEIVRDAALSASGLLTPAIGGPGVRPPQPAGVYAFTQRARGWQADKGPARYRRAMYTVFYRSAPYPLFTTFDAPDFQSVCTRRGRSNTPLQALTVANDEAFIELAQGLAARIVREVPADDAEARIRRGYLLCLCRQPSQQELEALRLFYERRKADFAQDAAAAKGLLSAELAKSAIPAETTAALVCVSRAILNTDNFITRE